MPERNAREAGEHPSLEVLSAYVDGGLDAREGAEVESHLAACEDCYELVTEVVQSEVDSQPTATATQPAQPSALRPRGTIVPFTRKRWLVPAAAMAAAAAAVIVAFIGPGLRERFGRPAADPAIAALVAAVGDERTVEGRLSGGFPHAPLRSAMRSGAPNDNLSLLAAAGELQKAAEAHPTPETLHAFGVAQLLLGRHDEAVATLERASAGSPPAAYLSDLSAAYIERARYRATADDWPRSLAAAERAIRIDPQQLGAWFNRACALESFGIAAPAREAWNDYLQRDGDSPWAEEARQRLAGIKPSAERLERWRSERARFVDTTPTVEQAAMLVSINPQASRELLEDEIWPAAVAADADPHWQQRGAMLAEALYTRTRDRLVLATQQRVAAAAARPALAEAFTRWKAAKALYAANRVVEMTPAFGDVAARFEQADVPLRWWADHYRLIGLFYQGRLQDASELGKALLRASEREGYTALAPRVRWDLGTILYQQARFEEALYHYREAGNGFETVGEFENATAINQLAGEALGRLGDAEASWFFHRKALARYDDQRDPRRRHTLLAGAGHSALNLGMGAAALPFFRAAVPNALGWNSPGPIMEAYLNQARAQLVLGDLPSALRTLDEARPWLPKVPDQAMKDRYGADFALAEAEALLGVDPGAGLDAANRAFAQYRSVASEFRLSALHLLRGRLERRLGDDDAAERDLSAGIALLESKRARVTQRALRVSFLDTVWDLYDDMVALQIARGRPEPALEWSERGRSRALLDAMSGDEHAPSPLPPTAVPSLLTPGEAVLYFHATPAELLTWIVSAAGVDVVRQPLPRARLIDLIHTAQRALEGQSDLRPATAPLYDAVLAPLRLHERGLQRLVIAPHGQMEFIPFAALWDTGRGRFVVEDYSLSVVPSLSTFAALRRTPAHGAPARVAVVTTPDDASKAAGLPALRAVTAEADAIRRLYPVGELVEPGRATETSLLRALNEAEVVHFAGHAIADAAYPWHARLVLAADEGAPTALRLEELPATVRASVVVLAACRTARGASSWGEGVTSLVTPFLQAGVESVIATLANVQDDEMRALSTAFHHSLVKGLQPAEALRQAQLSVLERQPGSALPAAWAGVTAYGVR